MGIFILLAIYVVLGFMLAWIAGLVAREEVDVKTGVLTLVVSGVLGILASLGIDAVLDEGTGSTVLNAGAQFVILTACIRLFAKLSWKHSLIIAVIYTVVINVIVLGLAACAAG